MAYEIHIEFGAPDRFIGGANCNRPLRVDRGNRQKRRFEAYRREEITRSKLAELAGMVYLSQNELGMALASAKLD